MRIKQINRQHRRDFYADYECENCGYIEKDKSGYDATKNGKKKEFVEALSDALKIDGRRGVKSIEYATDIWFENVQYEEVVQVNFKSGAYTLINTTANSNWSNAQEIMSAVYGGNPVGLLFSGFEEKECD